MTIRNRVIELFETHFGAPAPLLARAPGRVNLIGEHTDYNEGFVLPAAIDRAIYIAGRARTDDTINLVSADFGESSTFTLDDFHNPNLPGWTRYLRGSLWWLTEQGFSVTGFDGVIGGDIPLASGLSSSAAMEVVTIELGLKLAGNSMPQAEKALAGVEVEHQFIGMPCGVMDQMASAMGIAGHALLIDCRSLETRPIPIPEGLSLMVLNTTRQRGLVDSEYARRRKQCEEAAAQLGVSALRDATLDQLEAARNGLGGLLYRRARHIISENERTERAVELFEAGDLDAVGEALRASHASLRDDYEVSCAELDVMADLANAQPGCYGARMTGAGFGGCAVALVADEAVDAFVQAVGPAYTEQTGLAGEIYVCHAANGSGIELL
jgi:galactokinase